MELRGEAFAQFAAESLLAQKFAEHGFTVEPGSSEEEKDYGDGAVATFECGHVTFKKGTVTYSLYQSRFSDNWALDGPKGRTELTAALVDRDKLNDFAFVEELLQEAF